MKIRFYCDSGANISSCRKQELDLEKDLGVTKDEWDSFSEEEREEMVKEWMYDRLEWGYEVLGEDEE